MRYSCKFSARLLLFCALLAALSACTSNSTKQGTEEDGITFEENNPDKYESFNRKVYAFNARLDRWILKPVAKGYRWITPSPVETGIGNFFSNLGEIRNVTNDILQWKWKQAGHDSARFLMNSTFGMLGFVDVAHHAGLKKSDGEDFGQTLAAWGVQHREFLVNDGVVEDDFGSDDFGDDDFDEEFDF